MHGRITSTSSAIKLVLELAAEANSSKEKEIKLKFKFKFKFKFNDKIKSMLLLKKAQDSQNPSICFLGTWIVRLLKGKILVFKKPWP